MNQPHLNYWLLFACIVAAAVIRVLEYPAPMKQKPWSIVSGAAAFMLCMYRLCGVNGPAYQAVAHVVVGIFIGIVFATVSLKKFREFRVYAVLAGVMVVVEITAAFFLFPIKL